MSSELVIVGESMLGFEIANLGCERGLQVGYLRPGRVAGHLLSDVTLMREPSEAHGAAFVVVTSIHPRRVFLAGLQYLEAQLDPETALLVSGFGQGASALGAYLRHPGRVFTLGAVPPLGRLEGVAVGRGMHAHNAVYERVLDLAKTLIGRSYEGPDAPGLTLPRVVACLVNEAAFALGEGIAEAPDIDRAMRLGVNYPEGPLRWGDRIGLDQVLGCILSLYDHYGEDRYRPAPALRRLVQAGYKGRLTGQGFYTYQGVQLEHA